MQLREAYSRLARQMNSIFTQKLWFVMLEQFFMKYVWSGTGMVMVSLPILTAGLKESKFFLCVIFRFIDFKGRPKQQNIVSMPSLNGFDTVV